MNYQGTCTWNLDEEGTQVITILFNYFRSLGQLYVTEMEYVSDVEVSDETLKEAVINQIGPCKFEDTEILRSN